MPMYRYVYDGWQHGENHPDDRAALEAVDRAKKNRRLLRVERLIDDERSDLGGSSPHCSDGLQSPPVEVIWRDGEEVIAGGAESDR